MRQGTGRCDRYLGTALLPRAAAYRRAPVRILPQERRGWPAPAFKFRRRSIFSCAIGRNAPPTIQHGGSPHQRCRGAARCQTAGLSKSLSLTGLASWATALLVVHLQIFLARALPCGIVVPAVLLALGHAVRIVGDLVGLLVFLAHAWVRCGVKPDVSARDVISTPRRPARLHRRSSHSPPQNAQAPET